MGILSEARLVYAAITPAKKIRVEYDWALRMILLIYIPGMLLMFLVGRRLPPFPRTRQVKTVSSRLGDTHIVHR